MPRGFGANPPRPRNGLMLRSFNSFCLLDNLKRCSLGRLGLSVVELRVPDTIFAWEGPLRMTDWTRPRWHHASGRPNARLRWSIHWPGPCSQKSWMRIPSNHSSDADLGRRQIGATQVVLPTAPASVVRPLRYRVKYRATAYL